MIRAIPSNASDNVYCTLLAHSAIHGAMAGYCGFTVGPVNVRHCYIPISRVVATPRNVNIADRMWARLMSSTGQPNFANYSDAILESRQKRNALRQQASPTRTNGPSLSTSNGGEYQSEPAKKKPDEVIETGNRQGLPKEKTKVSFGDPKAP
jgi:6-phosphofructokinase 1